MANVCLLLRRCATHVQNLKNGVVAEGRVFIVRYVGDALNKDIY